MADEEQFIIDLRLTVAGYNMIQQSLGSMPYQQVKPLIDNLEEQVKAQVEAFNAQREATAAVATPIEVAQEVEIVDEVEKEKD